MDQESGYDIVKEAEEFEATKAGVKGLVDSGIKKIPRFFIQTSENSKKTSEINGMEAIQLEVPVIDLQGIEDGRGDGRAKIVDDIRKASETWGFFQMINHGVPGNVMDAILEATRQIHEQPQEAKADLYSADGRKQVRFFTINGSFRQNHVTNWRDAFACNFPDDYLDPEAIPLVCRKEVLDYMEHMFKMRELLSELLSEALGLNSDFLASIECLKSEYLTCLYYPACPQPDLTCGTFQHSDSTFLTLLVQDGMGGLQVLHKNHWVDVPPVPGALIANIGDVLQLITNDKFKSVEHRVLARPVGPRLSVACFFFPSTGHIMKAYGPIKELLSDDNPPIYKEVPYLEYVTYYQKMIRERVLPLNHFKL